MRDLPVLGEGAESCVFELDANRVLRVSKHELPLSGLEQRQALYDRAARSVPFRLPRLLDIGQTDDRSWSVEERIPGRPMSMVLPNLDTTDRQRLLANYLRAAEAFVGIEMGDQSYGELLSAEPLTDESWPDFLVRSMERSFRQCETALAQDADFDSATMNRLVSALDQLPANPPKTLVHGDFFPGNVMVAGDLEVTGVLDFSELTLVGDAQIDLAGSLMWLEVVPGYRLSDSTFLRARIVERHRGVGAALDFYRLFYSLHFAFAKDDDPRLYRWCVANLRTLR